MSKCFNTYQKIISSLFVSIIIFKFKAVNG
ncbi:uncharacterized protein METZ01_LOCUS457553 [marine metagenome]|uniref:Uncharacterized protein n=1 Tax=marine metagenome TaxID=408172 RepID=A0A383AAW0_9ZZZZ